MVDAKLTRLSVEFCVPSAILWLAPSEPTMLRVPLSVWPASSAMAPTTPTPLVPVPMPAAEISIPVSVPLPPAVSADATAAEPAWAAVAKVALRPRPELLMALIRPSALFP